MGMELAGAIIGFTLAGLWVDYHFQSRPVGILVGAGLGTIGGLYNLIREALAMSQDQDRPSPREDDDHDERSSC
jgi:F0F1-type ATP synthase assembly protein I